MVTAAVITGDIVSSTEMDSQSRESVLDALRLLPTDYTATQIRIEMFRGDSFQIVVSNPECGAEAALAARTAVQKATLESGKITWDARVSVGVGDIEYDSGSVVTSDGTAFRLSGRGIDAMGKQRLAISTPREDANDEFSVSAALADDIITNWTPKQAAVVYAALCNPAKQKDIAARLGASQQKISKLSNTAKWPLVKLLLGRYRRVVGANLKNTNNATPRS